MLAHAGWGLKTANTMSHAHRTLRRAAMAWRIGRPHRAWEILAEAGMADQWPTFQRVVLQRARARYTARMAEYRS